MQDFPPLRIAIEELGLSPINHWWLSNVVSWIISILIAIYCIKKYHIADKIDMKNNGLNWIQLGYIITFVAPILYFASNRIMPTADLFTFSLMYLCTSIIAPVLLLIGFIKVMSSYNQAKSS
jgi:hypothetical protein